MFGRGQDNKAFYYCNLQTAYLVIEYTCVLLFGLSTIIVSQTGANYSGESLTFTAS
jgi:hypothetical protein